jgi:hypothetical protein
MSIIEKGGRRYRVEIVSDNDQEPPWKQNDGEGIVSEWTTRAKRPGERIIASDRRSHRYFDFAATVRKARDESWDAEPYGTGTAGERAARATEVNFRRLKAWCDGDWCYVGVVVTPLCACCGSPMKAKAESLWGVESDDADYLETVAMELIEQIAPSDETEDCEAS